MAHHSIDATVQNLTIIDVKMKPFALESGHRFEVAGHWIDGQLDCVVVTNTSENPSETGSQIPIQVMDWIERTYRGNGLLVQIYAANKIRDLASAVR